MFNPQAPSKGEFPAPDSGGGKDATPARGWDSRQGKVPHHGCARPHFPTAAFSRDSNQRKCRSCLCGGELEGKCVKDGGSRLGKPFTSKCD